MAKKEVIKIHSDEVRWLGPFGTCVIPSKYGILWCAQQRYALNFCKSKEFKQSIAREAFTFKSLQWWTKEATLKEKGYSLIDDFEKQRFKLMLNAVREKFKFNPLLAQYLIDTKKADITFDLPYDDYFGVGKDGKGKDKYGKIVMRVREELVSGDLDLFTVSMKD